MSLFIPKKIPPQRNSVKFVSAQNEDKVFIVKSADIESKVSRVLKFG